ncbi:unnamed protein product, partial [Closterium sp. NIES-64]
KWEGLDVCEQFSLQQMLTATNNWSEDNVLGKGGFGVVYKGRSPQGQLWAIKRSTIMTNDFETEVRAMASLHHVHLVRLLGFCLDQNVETGKQEQILVYEFMANRDLEYHIHRTKRPLSLRQRLRLAQGTAEGLAYLHGFDTPIVHRDIKPANILVSADMQAKVADFGLLKRLTHGDADATRVAGTPGYVDPDYNRTHVITVKSDVFSFGIVLLQLLSGKSPHVDPKTHIRQWAMKLVEAYEVDELKDSKMPPVSEEAIVDFADLALDCIKSPGTRRPTMKDVAYRLSALIAKHCPDREDEWENVTKQQHKGRGRVGAGQGRDERQQQQSTQKQSTQQQSSQEQSTQKQSTQQQSSQEQSTQSTQVLPTCMTSLPLDTFTASPALLTMHACASAGPPLCAGAPRPDPCACLAESCLAATPAHCLRPPRCSPRFFCRPPSLLASLPAVVPSSPSPASCQSCGIVAWVAPPLLPIPNLVSCTHPSAPRAPPAPFGSFCSLTRLSCLVSVRDRRIGGGTGAGYVTACSLAPCITPILSLPLVSGIAFGPNPSNPIPMLKLLSIPPLLPTLSPMLTTPSFQLQTHIHPIQPDPHSQSNCFLTELLQPP